MPREGSRPRRSGEAGNAQATAAAADSIAPAINGRHNQGYGWAVASGFLTFDSVSLNACKQRHLLFVGVEK